MSVWCMSWVFHDSEARGYERLVLLALADEADDEGRNAFPSIRRIARKARVGIGTVPEVLRRLEAQGAILIDRPERKGRGSITRYTVVMQKCSAPEHLSEGSEGAQERAEMFGNVRERAGTVPSGVPTHTHTRTQEENLLSAPDGTDDVRALCERLATLVAEYREAPESRPVVTEKWLKDMRLLVERGPLGRAKPEALGAERVMKCLGVVFGELSRPNGGGFCWAAQIRSPHALRQHWDQMAEYAKRARRPQQRQDPLRRGGSLIRTTARLIEQDLVRDSQEAPHGNGHRTNGVAALTAGLADGTIT